MLKSIKKTIQILMMAVIVLGMSFGSVVYATSDTYANFAELSANEVYGVDYNIESKDNGSSVAIIAIHGGGIEAGTTQLAKATADLGTYNYYSFLGILKSGNMRLHITSTNFDEKIARDLVAKSKLTLSLHGCSGTEKITYLGGLDTALGKQVQKALTAAGFIVMPATSGLDGTSLKNIANSNLSGKGVQLEMTKGLRDSFLSSTNIDSAALTKYSVALDKGIKAYNAIIKKAAARG